MLNTAFSSTSYNWLCSKILVNILRTCKSEKIALTIANLLKGNQEYLKYFNLSIEANDNFTNINYLIEIINITTEVSSIKLVDNASAKISNSNTLIKTFPTKSSAGDYDLIYFIQQVNKIFTNVYQLLSVSNLDNSICSKRLKESYSFLQVIDNIMIIWTTSHINKLSPLFLQLYNLNDFEVLEHYKIKLDFLTSKKSKFSILCEKHIRDDTVIVLLKNKDNFASFEKILRKYSKKKTKKISVCNGPIMFISKADTTNLLNYSEDTANLQSRDYASLGSKKIKFSKKSVEIPSNQLANSLKIGSNHLPHSGTKTHNHQIICCSSTPIKNISAITTAPKKYGKKNRSNGIIKDIWDVASLESTSSTIPSPQETSLIPNSLPNYTPLRNNYTNNDNTIYNSENDTPLFKRRKNNIIYSSNQLQPHYTLSNSECLTFRNDDDHINHNTRSHKTNYLQSQSSIDLGNKTRSQVGNSTSIIEDISFLENNPEVQTADTTVLEAPFHSETHELISKGMELFSSSLLSKLSSLENFIHNKENEMKYQLELEFKNIHEAHKENIKSLYEFFIKETENISNSLK